MKKLTYFVAILIGLNFYNVVSTAQTGTGIISTYNALDCSLPMGMTMDALGNIYVVDQGSNLINKVAPSGIITVFAGTGTAGYSGDGGLATAATFNSPRDIAQDGAGNFYVTDMNNHCIRKISPSGIISTFAGNGSFGYSGDGGAAVAATLGIDGYLTADAAGNVYVNDDEYHTIRKINTAGIINTIAGIIDSSGFSGDGGPATAALLSYMDGMTVDASGNLYVSDAGNARIRKIDATGLISTIAGNGIAGNTGDGGPAASAEVNQPSFLKTDLAGNLIFSDNPQYVVREISTTGVISRVAGTGGAGYTGDGGPAVLATMDGVNGIAVDAENNVYIEDISNGVFRKVAYAPSVVADGLSIYTYGTCGGVNLTTVVNSTSTLSLCTSYGDGTADTTTFTAGVPSSENAMTSHSFSTPGTYSINEVVLNGGAVMDSARFSYQYLQCNNFAVKFYYDANGNCMKDSSEPYNYVPVVTEVDSNGVAVDTISATSGFYYLAYGNYGDIYTFKVLSSPGGFIPTCSGSGIVADTLDSIIYNVDTKYIGFVCGSTTNFDLEVNAGLITGRHTASGTIIVNNNYCTPENPVVTMDFSPQYVFVSSEPAATSVAGNTVTWDLSTLTAYEAPQSIGFTLNVPTPGITSTWLTPGDTLHFDFNVTPTTGDVNTVNNYCEEVKTVTGSWDPNEMAVTPSGVITSGTQLQYTIQFENTGNDTAFNISVYDTLSDYVDVNSLRIVTASSVMNTAMLKYNGHNIVKLDFPNINLLDSAYHNQCNGMVIFNINTLNGLPDGTTIFNHAGIFFDDNAAVLTDTVEDIIGIPTAIAAVNNASKVVIYPNPANDQVTISLDNVAYNTASITNVFGQQVLSQALNSTQTVVNVKTLPAGMYYITLTGDNGVKVLKFDKL